MAERIKGYRLDEGEIEVYFASTQEELEKHGFLPLEEAEKPQDGKEYRAVYEEVDGVIRQRWEEVA